MFTRIHKTPSILAIVFLLLGITGYVQNSISDQQSIVEFVIDKMWPIVLTFSCIFSYIHTFGYNKKEKKWKLFIGFLSFVAIFFMIFSFCFQGTIELLNSNVGYSRDITIHGSILSTESKQHKMGNLTFKLNLLLENDTIQLQVNESYFDKYKNASLFKEDMKEGVLKFLYKRN